MPYKTLIVKSMLALRLTVNFWISFKNKHCSQFVLIMTYLMDQIVKSHILIIRFYHLTDPFRSCMSVFCGFSMSCWVQSSQNQFHFSFTRTRPREQAYIFSRQSIVIDSRFSLLNVLKTTLRGATLCSYMRMISSLSCLACAYSLVLGCQGFPPPPIAFLVQCSFTRIQVMRVYRVKTRLGDLAHARQS